MIITADQSESAICWENNCTELDNDECATAPGCIIEEYIGNMRCQFDECNMYLNAECNEHSECVYTFDEGCHKASCDSINSDVESCGMNNKCEVVKGVCAIGCPENNCESVGYCFSQNDNCVYDICSQWKVEDCYKKEGCIWDESVILNGVSGLCKTGTCSSLSSEDDCNSISNRDLCAYINGGCTENICKTYNGNEICNSNKLCVWEVSKCVKSGCAEYTSDECLSGQVGCIYRDEYCVYGLCATLDPNDDECTDNLKCKKIMIITPDEIESAICWENNCTELDNDECITAPGCILEEYIGNMRCQFDECNMYLNSECNEHSECVYTFEEGCHKASCDSINSDVESCRRNNKCEVVKGVCTIGCPEKNCESVGYCLSQGDNCAYDICSQWKVEDCYKKEGCIWDESVILNGVSGLCKT
jgi:hypothetical protein